jgi:uncharacterized protein YyaL (SSP411 family)
MRLVRGIGICALLACAGTVSADALPGAAPFDAGLAAKLENARRERRAGYVPRTRHLSADGSPRFTNRLVLESSPYLLQHAHNPVDWHPWGEAAFETAKRLGRPVLLSVGYATCHWCHVMEEESFEDLEIARVLNEGYVAIKVDREERPDVDAIYMTAVQALGEPGGWPMTVWLTPERKPFSGGSYFPPRDGDRGVAVGFLSLLRRLRQLHADEGERVAETADTVSASIREALAPAAAAGLPDADLLHAAARGASVIYDKEWGGVVGAPKFPAGLPIRFLLRYHRRTRDASALEMATHTLAQMARGGVHDQLGGGFHRYSVDARWQVPHFEKMLYDQALIAVAYLEGYQASGRAELADVARDVLDYVARDMTSPEGAFYSATDADSARPDGRREEGRFFTWTPDEIREALAPEAARLVEAVFGVSTAGKLDGRSVLSRPRPLADVARELGLAPDTARTQLSLAREQLLVARGRRPPPLRDEKVLAAWNGLMISALARAASVLEEPRYAAQASRAADFVLTRMKQRGRLLRSYAEGKARHDACLEDYAFLIAGLVDLYEADSRPRWLEEAVALDRVLEARYEDRAQGGFFSTSDDHEPLLARAKPVVDGAEPSGNSVQALNLLRLSELTGNDAYRRRAEATLRAVSANVARAPEAFSELLLAAEFRLDTAKQIVLVAPSSRSQAEPLLEKVRAAFVPNRVLVVATQGDELAAQARLVPLLEGKLARGGKATAYVCERQVCEQPTSDPAQLAAQLAKVAPLPEPPSPERRAIAYLAREVPGWRREHACGSCHNNGDGARALFRARGLGHAVADEVLASTKQWLAAPQLWELEAGEPGTSDTKLARLQFSAALAAATSAGAMEDRTLLRTTAAALAADQDADGAWRIAQQSSMGSPVAYGPFVATWLAMRTLAAADGSGFASQTAKAEAFFVSNPALNVMDAAAASMALAGAASDAARERRREALELLAGAQTGDGGWGPYKGTAPEAFDTALALLALAAAGDAHRDEVARGRAYLERTQLEEGGWKETTRPPGYQSYAQHLSTTGWATLALLETAPRAPSGPRRTASR